MEALYKQLLHTYRNQPYEKYVEDRNAAAKHIASMSKENFTYDDYVPYPEYDDDNFNKTILFKKEFVRNMTLSSKKQDYDKVSSDKCSTVNFALTPSQKFIKGFMSPSTPYNGLLLFHGVGVGKTCTAITIAEQYHDIYKKKVLVILSSNLIDNFKKQIFDATKYNLKTNTANLCTGTKYSDMVMDKKKLSAEELQKRVNKIINEKYQFIGYKELAIYMDKIEKGIKDNNFDEDRVNAKYMERLSETFSNRLIIIDEAHNLRSASETGKTHTSIAFKKLLKNVVNVKLVLLTATPMFNSAKEIVWTLNLLLTNDKRPEISASDIFDEHGNMTPSGKIKLTSAARGYVSAIRGENPYTFPFRLYPSINNDKNVLRSYPTHDIHGKEIDAKVQHMEIIASGMSSYQKKVYSHYIKSSSDFDKQIEDDVDDYDEENGVSNDLQNTLQVSNIVFPSSQEMKDGDRFDKGVVQKLYGKSGLTSCISRTDKGTYSYKSDLQKNNQFLQYSKIGEYSPKIKKILDYVINSNGIVFIYSQYYSSGIIPIAIALEHIGFSKYQGHGGKGNIARNITVDDKFNGRKPQYIIVSRSHDLSPNNDAEIAASKSAANKDGGIIKVIIVSKIGTEGIDFKRIREVHILEPWFNLNRSEQIIGRAVRYCSHIDLPKSQRNVTIYFHACTYSAERESVDLRTYRMAENKQIKIIAVEKVLKETSIDCNLNRRNLVFPINKMKTAFDIETSQGNLLKDYKVGDRENSYVCGLGECKAVCDPDIKSFDDDSLDSSTFDKSFISDDITMYVRYIGGLYQKKQRRNMSFKTILRKLQKEYTSIEEEVLIYTLSEMVSQKHLIEDDLGRSGYLIYRGDQYIFQPNRLVDTRLTLDEREKEQYVRSHLSLTNIEEINETDKEKDKEPKKKDSKSDDKNAGILEFIEEQLPIKLALLEKSVGEEFASKPVIQASVLDSIIDSITKEQYTDLLNVLANMYNENPSSMSQLAMLILKSLRGDEVLGLNNDKKIAFAFNHFEGKVKCFRDGKFSECFATDSLDNKAFFEEVKDKFKVGLRDDTKSYVAIKDNGSKYKIRKLEKTKGFVCQDTSSLTVDMLKTSINEIMERVGVSVLSAKGKKKNISKMEMCWMYEILSRAYTPKEFQRPFFIKIETKKKVKQDA